MKSALQAYFSSVQQPILCTKDKSGFDSSDNWKPNPNVFSKSHFAQLKVAKKNTQEKRFLSDEEWTLVKRIMPDNCVRLMFEVLHATGLRIGELIDLRVKDVTCKDGKGQVFVRSGKGNKSRLVHVIHDEVTNRLQDYMIRSHLQPEAFLFLSHLGRPYKSGCSLNKILKHYCEIADIRD